MPQSLPDMVLRDTRKALERQPEQAPRRTQHETAAVLSRVPLFAGFAKRHLNRLAKQSDEIDVGRGQRIVEEGRRGETFFIVLVGHAKVIRGGRKIGEMVPGDFFGELSALDGGPRSASVVAETPMRLLRLFRHTLVELIEEEPQLALRILDAMVRRVRETERRRSAI
jgi:CRP/FNR family transcriptional regulator, cyclic AMP receptor protein